MKKSIFFILFCIWANWAFADNKQGIIYYDAGVIPVAKKLFEQQMNASASDKAIACYYLGEITYDAKNVSEALKLYQQGWSCSAEYAYNKVGEGKVLLQSDKSSAEKAFDAAIKVNKKDATVYIAIAAAYMANKMNAEAESCLETAKKIDPKAPKIFIYEGDLLAAANRPGDAAGKYEQAIYFDPQCAEAYLKYAIVYQGVTPSLSITMLQKILTNQPDYLPAYLYLGNIYAAEGHYNKAVEAYKNYFVKGLYSVDDLVHYASALFFDKQYADAANRLNEGLSIDPNRFLLKRLCFYNAYEIKDYEKGLQLASSFFNTTNEKFIWQDYLYYGRLLNAAKMYDESLAALNKAIEMDNTHFDIYKDMAGVYSSSGNALKAVESYEHYLSVLGDKTETSDVFQLGRYYYTAAVSQDSIMAKYLLTKADSTFAIVAKNVPDSYLGVFWEARVNSLLDPETEQGLAKPYYEAATIILEKNKDKHPKDLIECYRYMGYYYYLKKEMEESKSYWNKILEIDPNDVTAIEALKGLQ